jgi:hypothetical protein
MTAGSQLLLSPEVVYDRQRRVCSCLRDGAWPSKPWPNVCPEHMNPNDRRMRGCSHPVNGRGEP